MRANGFRVGEPSEPSSTIIAQCGGLFQLPLQVCYPSVGNVEENLRDRPSVFIHKFLYFYLFLQVSLSATEAKDWQPCQPVLYDSLELQATGLKTCLTTHLGISTNFYTLRGPRIDFKEPIQTGSVAWRTGTPTPSPHRLFKSSSTVGGWSVEDTGRTPDFSPFSMKDNMFIYPECARHKDLYYTVQFIYRICCKECS
jgi:hypothetical protein